MKKYGALIFCLLASLWAPAQTAKGIRTPAAPAAATFNPVNAKPAPSPVAPAAAGTQGNTPQQRAAPDLIREEIARYKEGKKSFRAPAHPSDTTQYQRDLFAFNTALQQLSDMLSGHTPLSLADAFYITEAAWGKPYLSRKEYDQLLDQSVAFIRTWMQQQGYDPDNNDAKHLAIQKFMSEKLTVSETRKNKDGKIQAQTVQHLPFFYDFEDYEGSDDYRNFFVTKCLATGGGQCNSMPIVYLLLAEKLDAPAYLSFAPQHALVRYARSSGELVNYEATTNWHISNQWYEESLFISPDAIRSAIYLDTLNKQKIVANCMLDLAAQYTRKMPNDNGKFIQDCLWESHFYFPQNNNINAYFVYSSLLKGWLSGYIEAHHITDPEQLKNDDWAYRLQKEYQQNEAYIKELGYRDLPEALYQGIVQQSMQKLERQQRVQLSGKTKRILFVTPKQL